ncbi:glycosyltransferase family 4 protein [Clostridium paraputrificum]|uniref:glycosyltransferase family 4 protein n=1 Tax=Clostridium paraputrificum TaxID=29363 RepID=UPI00374E9C74
MKKKILFIGNYAGDKFNIGFSKSSIIASKNNNCEFHYLSNREGLSSEKKKEIEDKYGIKLFHADICRNPLDRKNIKAYKQILELMINEKYDLIHCNTPTGGMLGRLCAKKIGHKKVIYMARGFHFFKGAPIKNWIIYYPIEKILARFYTDCLITINKEDYELAKRKFRLRNGSNMIYKVNGSGVDLNEFIYDENIRWEIRKKNNISDEDVVLLSVGEINDNKNHITIINAIKKLESKNIKFFIAGQGPQSDGLKDIIDKLGLNKKVKLLGYIPNVKEWYSAADIFVFPSKREGFGRAAIEAMNVGLPIITSNVHGIKDYSINGISGFANDPLDVKAFSRSIEILVEDKELRRKIGKNNMDLCKRYDVNNAAQDISNIYKAFLS